MSSPTLKDKPTLVTLEQFPCEIRGTRPNIVAKVAKYYRSIGTLLLHDEDGSKVDNIEREALRNPEDAMRGIFKTWLKQDTDCSWEKFINILKHVELNVLAKDIEDALRECKEPTEGCTTARKSRLAITTNNATAIANNAVYPQHSTALRRQSNEGIIMVEPYLSPQARPLQVHDTQETLTPSRADSFRDCLLKLKDTAAAKNWKFIGRRLELGESYIQQVEKEHGNDLREAFCRMMLKWRTTKGEQATYDELIEALKKENLTEVAEIVQQYQQKQELPLLLKLKDTAAAKNWKFIGRRLELGEPDIQQIEKGHGNDLREAFYQMMLKWRTTKGEQATYDELIEALKKENLTEVVEIVQQYQQRQELPLPH